MENQYEGLYNTLDPSKHEIRLLTIHVPVWSDLNDPSGATIVHCSLETFSLDEQPNVSFLAISYEWNPVHLMNSNMADVLIFVDGRKFEVTPNLGLFLVFASTATSNERFWIDAICINQNDLKERAQQVSYMKRIYSTACEVWCWLALHEMHKSGPMTAISLIKEIVNRIPIRDIYHAQDVAAETFSNWLTSRLQDPELQQTWNKLLMLCSDSYWQRGWVFQEIFVAKRVSIMSCWDSLDFDDLVLVNAYLKHLVIFGDVAKYLQTLTFELVNLSHFESRLDGWSPADLLSVLEMTAHTVTSDPRDKIYSMLGIANCYSNKPFDIDYTLSCQDVFKQTSRYIVEGSDNLNILTQAASGAGDLPSWMPNFAERSLTRNCKPGKTRGLGNTGLGNKYHKAGGELKSSVVVSGDCMSLTVNAICIQPMPDNFLWTDNKGLDNQVNQLKILIIYVMKTFKVLDVEQLISQDCSAVPIELIGIMLYQTLLVTVMSSSVYKNWKLTDFIMLVNECIRGNHRDASCTATQLQLLRGCFVWNRSFFITYLPASFSLVEDCLKDSDGLVVGPIEDPLTVAWLEKVNNLRLGCSSIRYREDWEEGDTITIVPGCCLPLILRPVARAEDGTPRFKIVGEAYVFGLMRGEAIGKFPQQTIQLV